MIPQSKCAIFKVEPHLESMALLHMTQYLWAFAVRSSKMLPPLHFSIQDNIQVFHLVEYPYLFVKKVMTIRISEPRLAFTFLLIFKPLGRAYLYAKYRAHSALLHRWLGFLPLSCSIPSLALVNVLNRLWIAVINMRNDSMLSWGVLLFTPLLFVVL